MINLYFYKTEDGTKQFCGDDVWHSDAFQYHTFTD